MSSSSHKAAEVIDASNRAIATWTVDQHYREDETLEARYGIGGRRMWTQEVLSRIAHLAESVAMRRNDIFIENANWSKVAFVAREFKSNDLVHNLMCLRSVLIEQLPKSVTTLTSPIIDSALTAIQSKVSLPEGALCPIDTTKQIAQMYLIHLLSRNRDEAQRLVLEFFDRGMSFAQICENILSPAMGEIGHMWQKQEVSIADEHYCNNATQGIMETLRSKSKKKDSNGFILLASSVGGDLHDLGIRIVSAIFEIEGWTVECLGANTPSEEIASNIGSQIYRGAVDILALSASTSLRIRTMQSVIHDIRQTATGKNIPILVGGLPFQIFPDLWKDVGANTQATSATSALQMAFELVTQANLRRSLKP